MNLRALDAWHKTRLGHLVFGLVELALGCWLVLLALNSGSLWEWVPAIVLLFGGLQNLVQISLVHKK